MSAYFGRMKEGEYLTAKGPKVCLPEVQKALLGSHCDVRTVET